MLCRFRFSYHFLLDGYFSHCVRLVAELYKEDLFSTLLQEDPNVAVRRKLCIEHIDALKKAKKVIQEHELGSFVDHY